MRSKFLWCLVVGLFVFSLPVFAQVAVRTGSIYGKVVDKDGAPLPGVTVSLESSVGGSQLATTGPSGAFRFAAVQPGTYALTFALEGFTELRQEEVRVTTGATVELNITLTQTLGEEFVVVADTPVVDQKKTGIDQTFTREYLDDVPTARDPWVIIDQTSGLDTDRYNVAGSESGQQSAFIARGGADDNTVWNVDGVNATDVVATGASPDYYDFDSFEELQISTAGNDVSIPTGGVSINIVLKRGTNRWSGEGNYYYSGDSLQSDKRNEEAVAQYAAAGVSTTGVARLDEVKDYGFTVGGPLVKDRLFVYGGGRKNEVGFFNVANQLDFTELKTWQFKANANLNEANEIQFAYFNNDKIKTGRPVLPGQQDTETLWDQGGPTDIFEGNWSGQYSWIANDHTFVNGRYSYIGNGFSLVPPAGADVPIIFNIAIPRIESTYLSIAPIDRPAHDLSADVNYFRENWGGADHEFKIGFEYKTVNWVSGVFYGNGQFITEYNQPTPGGPLTSGYLGVYLPILGSTDLNRTSFYVQDTIRKGRLTLNAGIRFDRNWGINNPSSRPTVAGFEAFLQPLTFDGNDPEQVFNDFSPRFGATFDVAGDGRTIIRGNYARYYDIYNPYIPYQTNPGFSAAFAGFYYNNLNGDRVITPDEVTFAGWNGAISSPTFDLNDFLSRFIYSDDLTNSYADEFLAGIERQISSDMSLAGTFTWRSYGNQLGQFPLISPDDFTPTAPFTRSTVLGDFNVPFWAFTGVNTETLIFRNLDGVNQKYYGLDIVGRKRMSNNLMLNGSIVLQRTNQKFDSPDATGWIPDESIGGQGFWSFDPTNVQFSNDVPYAYSPGGSGKAQVYPYSEWQFKLSGVYQFPWEFTTGVFLRYQQGYPYVLFATVGDRSLSGIAPGTRMFLVEEFASRRFENIFTMDLSLQKRFSFGNYAGFTLSADVFNLFNADTVIRRNGNIGSSSFDRIQETISPRALRLGARFSF